MIKLCAGSVFKTLSLCKHGNKPSDNDLADTLFAFAVLDRNDFIAHVKDCTKNVPNEITRYVSDTEEEELLSSVRECCLNAFDLLPEQAEQEFTSVIRKIIEQDTGIRETAVLGIDDKYQKSFISGRSYIDAADLLTNLLIYACKKPNNLKETSGITELDKNFFQSALEEYSDLPDSEESAPLYSNSPEPTHTDNNMPEDETALALRREIASFSSDMKKSFFSLGVIISIFAFLVIFQDHMRLLKDDIYEGAQEKYELKEYEEAGQRYLDASKIPLTFKTPLLYHAADSYYRAAIADDDPTEKETNFMNSEKACLGILKRQKHAAGYHVLDAMAINNNILLETGHAHDDPDCVELIRKIENGLDECTYDMNDPEQVAAMTYVYSSLIAYYALDLDNEIPSDTGTLSLPALEQYFLKLSDLSGRNGRYIADMNTQYDPILLVKYANTMIRLAISSDLDIKEKESSILSTIQICQNKLDTIESPEDELYEYASLKRSIIMGYWYLSALEDETGTGISDIYMPKVYKESLPLLNIDLSKASANAISEIVNACFYLSTTEQCSADDLEFIGRILRTDLDILLRDNETSDRLFPELYTISGTCQYILRNYGYNKVIYETGFDASRQIIDNINLLRDGFLTKETLKNTYEYFANYSVDE